MTTFTATRAASTFPAFAAIGSGIRCAAYGTIAVAANPVAADIYEMCYLPAGAVVLGGWLYLDDLDTNATETLDLDVGWAANGGSGTYDAADPDGLCNCGVMNGDAFAVPSISNVVGNIVPFSTFQADGKLPFFTKKTKIQVVCIATCATFTAGSMSVVVDYVVDSTLIA